MHKIDNKKLKAFRLNPRLGLLRSSTLVLSAQLLTLLLYYFICYLAAAAPTSGLCREGSLTNLMLIAAFYLFRSKETRSLVMRLGPKAQLSAQWGLTQEASDSECNALTH